MPPPHSPLPGGHNCSAPRQTNLPPPHLFLQEIGLLLCEKTLFFYLLSYFCRRRRDARAEENFCDERDDGKDCTHYPSTNPKRRRRKGVGKNREVCVCAPSQCTNLLRSSGMKALLLPL